MRAGIDTDDATSIIKSDDDLMGQPSGGARGCFCAAPGGGARRVASGGRSGRGSPLRALVEPRGAARGDLQCVAVGEGVTDGSGWLPRALASSEAFGVSLGGS